MLDDLFILYAHCGSAKQAERRARITERAVREFLETLGFQFNRDKDQNTTQNPHYLGWHISLVKGTVRPEVAKFDSLAWSLGKCLRGDRPAHLSLSEARHVLAKRGCRYMQYRRLVDHNDLEVLVGKIAHLSEGHHMRLSLCSQMWRDLSNPKGRRGSRCLLTHNSRKDLQTLAHLLLGEPQEYYPPLPMFTVPMDFQNHIFSDASREGMGGHFGPLEWQAQTPLDLADQFDRGTITIAHLELYAANLTLHLYLEYLRGCYPRQSCSPHVVNAWCDN